MNGENQTIKRETLHRINEIDAKILGNLLKDGRLPYDDLAERCDATKNTVWKRCRSLERKGIIKGATVQLNFSHFGYDALATLLIKVDPQRIEQAMEFIEKITEIRAYRQYDSVYNVRATVTLKDLNQLDTVKQLIREKLPTIGLKTYVWTGVRNIPENLDLNVSAQRRKKTPGALSHDHAVQSGRVEIDELDEKIVQKLTADGRTSFSQIAKELGISTHTVIKRYQRLRNGGAIKVSVQINTNKLGYSSILDLNIAFTTFRGLSINIVDAIAKIPNVIIITRTSGDFDLQVTAIVRDLKESFSIQDKIAQIDGVTQIEASTRKIPDSWPTPQQYISTV